MRLFIALLLLPGLLHAAEEDRGPRGFYLGFGGGLMLGAATDEDGASAPGFLGNGGHLRLGEEVLPGFTLGLRFGGGGGASFDDDYETGLGGFALETTVRPLTDAGWTLMAGVGVGGGSLDPKDGGPEGSAGGSMLMLGTTYEWTVLGQPTAGLAVAPTFTWSWFPAIRGNPAQLHAFIIGVETVWYAGR